VRQALPCGPAHEPCRTKLSRADRGQPLSEGHPANVPLVGGSGRDGLFIPGGGLVRVLLALRRYVTEQSYSTREPHWTRPGPWHLAGCQGWAMQLGRAAHAPV